jgi:hypothetical protein
VAIHVQVIRKKLRTRLLSEADGSRSARTNATLGYLLDRWLPRHDIDDHTRDTYDSLIRNHIRPAWDLASSPTCYSTVSCSRRMSACPQC